MASVSHGQYPQKRPNGLWRGASAMTMGLTTTTSKVFLYGLNRVEVTGLDKFVELLESRRDPFERERGLITVSNHMSVIDDPLIWGVLPMQQLWQPWNLRWGLGAHDICFANKLLSTFFTLGQVLPVHRNAHSPHAGLYQPSLTQAIRLLSAYPFKTLPHHQATGPATAKQVTVQTLLADLRDPFSEGSLTYTTTGSDVHTAPSAFLTHRHAWVHVFPEGLVHQHPQRHLRYFKWGVARLILEAEPMPDLVPMFVDGTCDVMHESRGWPRGVPRAGRDVRVVFGERVDMEATFGDLRRRWKRLVAEMVEKREREIEEAVRLQQRLEEEVVKSGEKKTSARSAADQRAEKHGIVLAETRRSAAAAAAKKKKEEEEEAAAMAKAKMAMVKKPDVWRIGDLPEELRDGNPEVDAIRIEVARRVREEVLKVRRSVGVYEEEKPEWGFGLAKTWARDQPTKTQKSEVDGSLEKPGI